MSDYLSLPIKEINELLKNKKILPIDLVNEFVEKVSNDQFNTFITLDIEGAIKQAHELENKEVDNLLFAIPLVINDNIVTKGIKTSCGSLMLDNFYPIYDASVVERVKEKNMIIVGKANMSEFDISLDEGYYGLVKNKINDEHIGGSGGSVVSVSVGYTPISLATSINENLSLASSLSQVVSLKPTYGLVSRYGLISPTSSFEQIAPISKNIIDNAILFDAIIGFDEKDYMTVKDYKFNINNLKTKLKNKRVAIPNYYLNDNLAEGENNLFKNIIQEIKKQGFTVEYVNIPYVDYISSVYNIIASGEISSNMSRFDGIRYGYSETGNSHNDIYVKTRTNGFGRNIKQLIINGAYVLSKDNLKYYYKALALRTKIIDEYKLFFQNYDFILIINPDELLLKLPNILGTPVLSMPLFNKHISILGKNLSEESLYKFGLVLENLELGGEFNA